MCCVPCHLADPSIVKVWRSVQGFGRHVQSAHPEWVERNNTDRKTKSALRTIQGLALAREARRFERQGLRRIPIKRLDDRHLEQVAKWVHAVKSSRTNSLLLSSIELADERFSGRTKFDAAIRNLTAQTEAGVRTGTFVTSIRPTHFDPRVALEIFKLCWALGRGWSFVVHILLLYGLNAFVEALNSEGIVPPTQIPQLPKPADFLTGIGRNSELIMDESNFQ